MSDSKTIHSPGPGFTTDARTSTAPDRHWYTDPALYVAETASIFQREWQYFCHQTQLPANGDYIVANVGGESVYVIRGKDSQIRGFFNVCQHRGHQLLHGSGSARGSVQCPYHAWTYGLDGALRAAPKSAEVPEFDKSCVHLSTIGVEVIAGFVFVNLDDGAESLRSSTPRFEQMMFNMVGEAETLQYVSHQDFEIDANWKVVSENFLEAYHVNYSGPHHVELGDMINLATYAGSCDGKVIEYIGAGGAAEVLPYSTTGPRRFSGRPEGLQQIFLWPNVSFSVFPGADMLFVFLIVPTGPQSVAERIIYFSLDGTTDESAQSAIDWINDELGPEDVELVESVQRGLQSMGYKSPGRLMVDAELRAPWSERFVHHFNLLNVEAVNRS